MTLTRREAIDLLERHGVRPSRSRGQNFVVDPNTVRRIARLAGVGPGDRVIEIGAGLGALTLALSDTGAEVTAVEIDRHLMPILEQVVGARAVRVVEGDALALDWDAVLGDVGPWTLVANLPYNVATPLVVRLLEEVPLIASMLVMVQAEVGERLAARAGTEFYGAVSVKVAYWAEAKVVGRVAPSVFLPRPKVDSALVALRRHDRPGVDPALVSYERLMQVVRTGFAQRRKMLRRSLAGTVDPAAFVAAEVRPEARAEELDLPSWARLAAWTFNEPQPS